MKQKIACALFIIIGLSSATSLAQIKFEKGYIITNSGEKINCFIKDREWKNNPKSFTYRKTKKGPTLSINSDNIKELKILKKVFVNELVDIDLPINNTNDLRTAKATKLVTKKLLLERVINGDVVLYLYIKNSFRKFFFRKKNGSIVQLNYKKYIDDDNKVKEDNLFQRQLWDNFKCSGDKVSSFSKLRYKRRSIISVIVKYAKCNNLNIEVSKAEKINLKDLVNISPKIGVNFSGVTLFPQPSSSEFKTKTNTLSLTYGGEIEFFVPLLNKKIAVVGSFLKHEANKTFDYTNTDGTPHLSGDVNVDYQSTNISLGLRYYFYLNDDSRVFSSLSYSQDKISGNFNYNSSQFNLKYADVNIDENDTYLTFGFGYKHKRVFVELLYSIASLDNLSDSAPPVAVAFSSWNFDRNIFSINFGYNLF